MATHGTQAYNHTVTRLSEALMSQGEVRFLEDDDEVRAWVRFDDDVYGPGVISYELLLGWWSSYRKGAIALFNDNRIDAIFAVWPLKSVTFRQILRGSRREKDIGPSDVVSKAQSKRCRTWYLSGFAVRKTCSIDDMVGFLRKAIGTWITDASPHFPLELCAFGFSPQGENLLKRFGFSLYKSASGEETWPVYLARIASRRWLQGRLSRIKAFQQKTKGRRTEGKSPHINIGGLADSIQESLPNCDSIIITYFRESIDAFKASSLRCSAFLLGAASERAISLLIDSYAEAFLDEKHRQRFEDRTTKNKVISKRFEEFMQSYKSCKTHPEDPKLLHESLNLRYTFDRYRVTRNEVGHPAVIAKLDKEDLLIDLAKFVSYLKTIYGLIAFFKSHRVEV